MDLEALHQQVDEKLEKLDEEIERFKTNIETSDDAEQRELLEKDLQTLHVIREKLLKARSLTQKVTDLREQVENPATQTAIFDFSSPITWLLLGVVGVASAFAIWGLLQV